MLDTTSLKFKRNLSALVEFSRIINSSLDLNFILSNVLLTCMGKFLATKGIVALNQDGELKLISSKGISQEVLSSFPLVKIDENCELNDSLVEFNSKANLQVIEKINSSKECLGIVVLGEKLNHQEYTEDDVEFFKTILNISATAIQNSIVINELKNVNRELDSRVQRLNSLFDLSKEFGLFSEETKISRLLVFSIIGQFLVSKYAVVSFEGAQISVMESKFPVDELLTGLRNVDYKEIKISINSSELEKTNPSLFNSGVHLIVPMQIQGKTRGLILLGGRVNKQNYSEGDIEFIYSVGSLAMISLENKKLFKEALEKQKLEEELDIAREIQQNLLPAEIPKFSSFELAAFNLSSKQVGGDYYDIIKLDEQKSYVAIADVSGKGFPAALLMANLQAFLHVICHQNLELHAATRMINDLISENTSDGKFITFFWGILNEENKTFNYVNAGHNPPLLIRDNKIIKLEKGGIVMGVMKSQIDYLSEEVQLLKDDVLVMFTDGITEAMNINGEEYSDPKFEEICLKSASLSVKEILSEIQVDVQKFSEGANQSDDLTLIVIKVK